MDLTDTWCRADGATVGSAAGTEDRKQPAQPLRLYDLDGRSAALDGAQLAGMSERQWNDAARSCNVFARVAPEHKLKLVREEARRVCDNLVKSLAFVLPTNLGLPVIGLENWLRRRRAPAGGLTVEVKP